MSRRRRLLMRAVRALERKRRRRGRVWIYRAGDVYVGGVPWSGVIEVRIEEPSARRLEPPPL